MHDVSSFLHAHGITLRKHLGQHFLVNLRILDAIVQAAKIEPEDHIVEIGAGIGILTKELLEHARRVTAIELDRRLIPLLHAYTGNPKLEVIHGDALRTAMPSEPYKIVANIPYEITSPLLRHLFLDSQPPASLTLLIQREVAEKICEQKRRGRLAILVQLFGTPHIVRRVSPSAFLPPPKVESAVLHITCFAKPLADPETLEEVFRLTKLAFGKKRKMLRSSLGKFPGFLERLKAASLDPERRPETVSIEEWITLARTKE
jgi:16S rRNA (adenine1518-N6/adenine1519-N6)-dimethyltransferase